MDRQDISTAVAATALETPAPVEETGLAPSGLPAEALIEFDVLVEDVSIDGMCGVY